MSKKRSEKPRLSVPDICQELQLLQKSRAWNIKSKGMIANRLCATVAGTIGYSTKLKDSDRKKKFKEASAFIKRIVAGEVESELEGIVLAADISIAAFDRLKLQSEEEMKILAEQLHVAKWVEHPDQRGFGILFLGIIIGETGDLSNYEAPGKVWRRLGCAPYTHNGKTRMGATWKGGKNGKLPAEEWEKFGYSPRRRSIAYLIGEGIVKQNGASEKPKKRKAGPYRLRYDETKALAAKNHPEWLVCTTCKGTGKVARRRKCDNCKGTGKVQMHCHLHGMLLATKLLLKNLWIEWNK